MIRLRAELPLDRPPPSAITLRAHTDAVRAASGPFNGNEEEE